MIGKKDKKYKENKEISENNKYIIYIKYNL